MDIGREVRTFRAEPVCSPVPGEQPVVEEPVVPGFTVERAPAAEQPASEVAVTT